MVYYYIVTARAPHLDNGHTTCATKNDTPALSAPEFNRDIAGSESHSQEIQNYTNGGKTRENIRFEIKKMIDSKGMDSEGMEGKHRKIFGSNSKVSNPND